RRCYPPATALELTHINPADRRPEESGAPGPRDRRTGPIARSTRIRRRSGTRERPTTESGGEGFPCLSSVRSRLDAREAQRVADNNERRQRHPGCRGKRRDVAEGRGRNCDRVVGERPTE